MNKATECIDWKAACPEEGEPVGYGQASFYGVGICSAVRADRLSYATYVGEVPEGSAVKHSCGRKSCVTPRHLFLT